MNSIRQAIALVLLTTLALAGMGSALFIGFGALLAHWLPLTLFQASCIAIGAAFTLAVTIFAITYIVHFQVDHAIDNDLNDWDMIDDEDDQGPFPEPNKSKIRRNSLCPCGSTKKYKHCCGNSASA